MTGAARDPGTSANFRYTTSTDVTVGVATFLPSSISCSRFCCGAPAG